MSDINKGKKRTGEDKHSVAAAHHRAEAKKHSAAWNSGSSHSEKMFHYNMTEYHQNKASASQMRFQGHAVNVVRRKVKKVDPSSGIKYHEDLAAKHLSYTNLQ